MSPESPGREVRSSPPDNPSLASTKLVPSSSGNVSGNSKSPSPTIGHPPESSTGVTSISGAEPPHTSHLASFRDFLKTSGLSEDAQRIYCASWRGGTAKLYESAWRKWFSWCRAREINPFQAIIYNITEYLTSLFQEGREYSTINTKHSMLSVTLPPVDGSVIGKHPIICRFMQGIFNSRPPKPRYSFVWDMSTVISYMDTMPPNEKLCLKDLSAKLVMLMVQSE